MTGLLGARHLEMVRRRPRVGKAELTFYHCHNGPSAQMLGACSCGEADRSGDDPVPGQKLIKIVGLVLLDAGEHVGD
jgi:hypothetical protein